LIDASKEVGLKIKIDKPAYVAISSPECRSEFEHRKANKTFENVSEFRY
jgi:hypothetical protein